MRAKMSTNQQRLWEIAWPHSINCEDSAMAEARALVAEADDRECFDVASIEQIAWAASEACGVAFREAHANIRGALAECLASFIVDGPAGLGGSNCTGC